MPRLAGLFFLSLAVGALIGLANLGISVESPLVPLEASYVKLVGELYAKGENIAVSQVRLEGICRDGDYTLVSRVAGGSAAAGAGDLSAMLVTLAPGPMPTATVPVLLAAGGRGSDPTPPARVDGGGAKTTSTGEFPLGGRVSATKGDASLRTKPALNGAVLRIIPRGSELVLLGVEQGQAVEGAEDRWYRVRQAEATGYIYFTLIEPAR